MRKEIEVLAVPLKVLMVDDSELDAELFSAQLVRAGFEVECTRVDTEADFARCLQTAEWQLIVSDWSLPRFSGLQALDIARRRQPDIPFLFVSGSPDPAKIRVGEAAGAPVHLAKDNLTDLRAVVLRALASRAQ